MKHLLAIAVIGLFLPSVADADHPSDAGDAEAGRQLFRACAACHALEPSRHMTGPSLADIWGRQAATLEGFNRYSEALENSEVVWDAHTLDAWLADPQALVPGTTMVFPGLDEAQARRDLIAFLRTLSEGEVGEAPRAAGPDLIDLKTLEANNRVTGIGLCGDTYTVTTEAGGSHRFWEFNLRFKTDGSDKGPAPGQPVIIPGGMRGDRAYVVFASPDEISAFIATGC